MALSTALMLAPTAIKLGNQALGGGSEPSEHEKRLLNMADIFQQEGNKPITENRAYKTGKTQLDQRDRDNRKAIDNQSAITGGTDEAKLANMDNSNRSYNQGLNQLLQLAEQFRGQSRNRYMNTIGAAENARSNRVGQYNQKMNSILDPIGEAGKAFAMADMFADDEGGGEGVSSNPLVSPNGFGGGSTRSIFN